MPVYDWLIVGAGFAGSVLAERLASQRNDSVLLIDRRRHIGGNAFDRYDTSGVLIHEYGPHIFHTNSEAVFSYLSNFTRWRFYEHRVLASVDGQLVPIPINLDTINRLYGLSLNSEELERFFAARAERGRPVRNSEDVVVASVGRELYEKFFRYYTRKQWGVEPSALDKSVTARVPVRTNRDDRYFTDRFQFMPADGYTAMFQRMLRLPNIRVLLGVDFAQVRDACLIAPDKQVRDACLIAREQQVRDACLIAREQQVRDACLIAPGKQVPERIRYRRVIYTGPIDEFFDFRLGKLPYRSLRFEHQHFDQPWYQPVGVVNYPQDQPYTRVTEYKHLTGQSWPTTSITHEYPCARGEPYYPIPRPENAELFRRYEQLARGVPDVWFVGRLATYRYYNMDQVVAQALATFARIDATLPRTRAAPRPVPYRGDRRTVANAMRGTRESTGQT